MVEKLGFATKIQYYGHYTNDFGGNFPFKIGSLQICGTRLGKGYAHKFARNFEHTVHVLEYQIDHACRPFRTQLRINGALVNNYVKGIIWELQFGCIHTGN